MVKSEIAYISMLLILLTWIVTIALLWGLYWRLVMYKKTVKNYTATKQQLDAYYQDLKKVFKEMRENHGDREADIIDLTKERVKRQRGTK